MDDLRPHQHLPGSPRIPWSYCGEPNWKRATRIRDMRRTNRAVAASQTGKVRCLPGKPTRPATKQNSTARTADTENAHQMIPRTMLATMGYLRTEQNMVAR